MRVVQMDGWMLGRMRECGEERRAAAAVAVRADVNVAAVALLYVCVYLTPELGSLSAQADTS
eukprot:6940852-Karenia_brevis.AAC.1